MDIANAQRAPVFQGNQLLSLTSGEVFDVFCPFLPQFELQELYGSTYVKHVFCQ